MESYERKLSSDMAVIKPAVSDAVDYLQSRYPLMTHECVGEFKLILSELIINAVLHGNGNDHNLFVDIAIHTSGYTVCIEIEDEGEGFDYRACLCREVNLFSSGGRGIQICSHLTDRMSFNESGNKVTLVKRVVMNE